MTPPSTTDRVIAALTYYLVIPVAPIVFIMKGRNRFLVHHAVMACILAGGMTVFLLLYFLGGAGGSPQLATALPRIYWGVTILGMVLAGLGKTWPGMPFSKLEDTVEITAPTGQASSPGTMALVIGVPWILFVGGMIAVSVWCGTLDDGSGCIVVPIAGFFGFISLVVYTVVTGLVAWLAGRNK